MKCNLALWDRILRFVLGFLLIAYLIGGGPIWAAGGFYLLLTAGWGWCAVYGFFRFRTLRESSTRNNP